MSDFEQLSDPTIQDQITVFEIVYAKIVECE